MSVRKLKYYGIGSLYWPTVLVKEHFNQPFEIPKANYIYMYYGFFSSAEFKENNFNQLLLIYYFSIALQWVTCPGVPFHSQKEMNTIEMNLILELHLVTRGGFHERF